MPLKKLNFRGIKSKRNLYNEKEDTNKMYVDQNKEENKPGKKFKDKDNIHLLRNKQKNNRKNTI